MNIKKLIESGASVVKITRAVNEVTGVFTAAEKDFILSLYKVYYPEPTKLADLYKMDLQKVSRFIYGHTEKLSPEKLSMAKEIMSKLDSLSDRSYMMKKSSEGNAVIKVTKIKSDNSGPWATTGSSVDRFTVKSHNPEGVRDWAERTIAKSSYLIDCTIVGFSQPNDTTSIIDVKSTVYYN